MTRTDENERPARLDWGLDGLHALAPACSVVIVVDVLSFSTAVDVALGAGARVLPLRWRDDRARRAAETAGAVLAAPRAKDRWSLSPSSLRAVAPGTLLGLPSPNGATLCATAEALGMRVLAGCLRNAGAVARLARTMAADGRIGILPAGEQRADGIRFAVEDLLGAGAIAAHLTGRCGEAEVAARSFDAVADRMPEVLADCVSGRELAEWGFAEDVALAAEVAVSEVAPVLRDSALVAA